MATAKKLPSGSWRIRVFDYKDDDGVKHYKSFTNRDPSPKGKREVEKEAAAWAADRERAKSSSMTLGQAMDAYIDSRSATLSPNTVREYKAMRKRDLQNLMDIPIDNITQEMVQAEINREAQAHSPKSVRNMHGLLTAVLRTYRPAFALRTSLPKKIRPNIYVPTDGDIRRIIDTSRGTPMEIPILLAAFGPMRRGEICALDSDHVNGNVVHVEYSLARNDKGEYVLKPPKSYAGDRYIEYPDFVAEKLQGTSGKIVDMLPLQIDRGFKRVLKQAGVPDFRFHDLRHYSASILHAIGIPDAYIMKRGGWSDDNVLKNVYRHTMADKDAEMTARINDQFQKTYVTGDDT